MALLRPGIIFPSSEPSVRRLDRMIRDPVSSPRVMRAVMEDLIEAMQEEFQGMIAAPTLQHHMQHTADAVCHRTYFRGTPLSKLFTLEVKFGADGTSAIFSFRPQSEDGKWLLQQMNLEDKPPELPKVEKPQATFNAVRIVEI